MICVHESGMFLLNPPSKSKFIATALYGSSESDVFDPQTMSRSLCGDRPARAAQNVPVVEEVDTRRGLKGRVREVDRRRGGRVVRDLHRRLRDVEEPSGAWSTRRTQATWRCDERRFPAGRSRGS